MLADSQKLLKTAPSAAIRGLMQAEEFGSADEEKGLPDLLGTANPSIPMRRMDLRSSMDRREKMFQIQFHVNTVAKNFSLAPNILFQSHLTRANYSSGLTAYCDAR